MKTRHYLLGVMGLLLMASCAKDEVVDISRDGDEIAFNVATNAETRVFAGENGIEGVYCNLHLPPYFHVWAITGSDQQTYINGDKVVNEGLINMLANAGQNMLSSTDKLSSGYRINRWRNTVFRYWPESDDETLDFYAAVNATSSDENYTFNWNDALKDAAGKMLPPTITVTIPDAVADQKDLLYAVMKDQSKVIRPEPAPEDPGDTPGENSEGGEVDKSADNAVGLQISGPHANVVNLNFRHALSQVVFTAQNPNENLYVEVKGVSICNVNSHNTFTYPSKNTLPKISTSDHLLQSTKISRGLDQAGYTTQPYDDGTWGDWGKTPTNPVNYEVTLDEPLIIPPTIGEGRGEIKAPIMSLSGPLYEYSYVTGQDENGEDIIEKRQFEYNTNAMLLLPQQSTAWDPKTIAEPIGNTTAGTYFLVDCLIVNIVKEGETITKKLVWGEEGPAAEDGTPTYTTKKVAVPVKLTWKQGKKYIYNFVFGAFGGYDPEDPDPDPDLVPIAFNLTVDEFETVRGATYDAVDRDVDVADPMEP